MATPQDTVEQQCGVDLPFSFPSPAASAFSLGSSSKKSSSSETWRTVNTVVPEKEKVTLPLFNVVDDGNSTQEKLAQRVAKVWDIRYGFLNSTISSLVQQFAKTDFSDMVEDVNETVCSAHCPTKQLTAAACRGMVKHA